MSTEIYSIEDIKQMLSEVLNTTDVEKAILFGIPVSMIKGIMISRKLEKDNNVIQRIRELFPKCYICNLDGIVI